ncbi:lysine 2,3-aminomutase [Bradyrhizobium sp. USDA 336]|uniref:lysine 2,3-aminomutase n=1 Tax=Bradyrhizobium sp. USDA 336 TaxID=3156311 RepID=UPI00384D32F1
MLKLIEETRAVSESELQVNNITPYHVTKSHCEQIVKSGYYDQLKYIVEPSIREFDGPGTLHRSGEHDNTVVPGLQHKYAQNGILLVTERCGSYCRYCLRKRIVGKVSDEIAPDFGRVAQYIARHPETTNVLLSGGDPFVLSTSNLNKTVDHLLPIEHLKSIRLGTKMLAYAPERFDESALSALVQRIHRAGKSPIIIAHFDHVGEISSGAERKVRALRLRNCTPCARSSLKSTMIPEILAATFAKCHEIGVRPYYLFQARPVKGGSHFQVALGRGLEMVACICGTTRIKFPRRWVRSFPDRTSRQPAGWMICPNNEICRTPSSATNMERLRYARRPTKDIQVEPPAAALGRQR